MYFIYNCTPWRPLRRRDYPTNVKKMHAITSLKVADKAGFRFRKMLRYIQYDNFMYHLKEISYICKLRNVRSQNSKNLAIQYVLI